MKSGNQKPRIIIIGQDVYLYEQLRDVELFKKVDQFDAEVWDWDVDARGVLWACLRDGKVARLEVVAESFNACQDLAIQDTP